MHHESVTTNYAWLPHNVNESIVTPEKYLGMPIQPLGDRQRFHKEHIEGCVDYYREKGNECLQFEKERIAQALHQPRVSLVMSMPKCIKC